MRDKAYVVFVLPLREMFADVREVIQVTKHLFRR